MEVTSTAPRGGRCRGLEDDPAQLPTGSVGGDPATKTKSGEIPEKVGVVPESFNVALTAVVHTLSAVHCRVVVDCIDRRAVGLSDIVPCTVGVAG